jgi:Skp family chaperone for outer membrane proteins
MLSGHLEWMALNQSKTDFWGGKRKIMMRINKYGLLLALLVAPAVAMAQEARVVGVNTEQAVLKSDAGKAADTKLTAKVDEKKKEFDGRKREIEQMKEKLDLQANALSEQAKEDLRRKIKDAQTKFDRDLEDTDLELEKMRSELLGPVVKAAREQLDKLVTERNIDIVIDLAGDGPAYFPYVNEKILVTDELVKRINAAIKTSSNVDAARPPASTEAAKPTATKTP